MRVLVGPRVDLDPAGAAAQVCARLAGEDGEVVSLAALGLRNPYRRWSAAEVEALRAALRAGRLDQAGVVGYVCRGVALSTSAPAPGNAGPVACTDAATLVAVTDNVNLTWRSPLTGPNDDRAGPRFPSMDGAYAPDLARRGGGTGDMMVAGVVAGVIDDRALTGNETEMAGPCGWVAVSSELVAPVIVAAHMGLRVAAVVLV